MATLKDFTMKDLAEMALGVPQLNQVNIHCLHTLIDLLLKKLNCTNETVNLFDYKENQCLKEVRNLSKPTPLRFQVDNLEVVPKRKEIESQLNEHISHLSKDLKNYVETKTKVQLKRERYDNLHPELYADLCEDIYLPCEPENEIACELLKNTDFMRKMLRHLTAPVVDRYVELEEKIKKFSKELNEFLVEARGNFQKLNVIEMSLAEIRKIETKVDSNHLVFLGTMEEVQDMLDSKFNNYHIAEMKSYINGELKRIDNALKELQTDRECPRAAGVIKENLHCISCGSRPVCANVIAKRVSTFPNAISRKPLENNQRHCGCCAKNEPTLRQRMEKLTSNSVSNAIRNSCFRSLAKQKRMSLRVNKS